MDTQIQLTALSREEFIKLLRKSGAQLASEETVCSDIDDGAPVNSDGTFNLIAYAAWLMRQRTEENND